jgi:threonyl-tRNA synthetase
MKILQLDVDDISYELVKPEASVHEEGGERSVSVKDALVMLVSVEKGDDKGVADMALSDARKQMAQLKRDRLVIYPFAHLSSDLAAPGEAMQLIQYMYDSIFKEMEVKKAPFGWNKKLSLSVKGHPLAEQSKSYRPGEEAKKVRTAAKQENAPARGGISASAAAIDTSVVRKSDWAGLPDTDHRTIGERLDLYSFQEVSPGMTYWHPNGYIIYKELLKYIREKLEDYGYLEIATPAFANIALWHVSGHDEHYKDNMYLFDVEGQEYGLKPMNCPSTFMVYKSRRWSYRDLPVRFADFDKLYRNEISGALTGLFRVREMTQDDAHIFVRDDQIEDELVRVLDMIGELYAKFGLEYKAKLSTMPDDHAGEKADWDIATSKLMHVLDAKKMKYELKEKEGAFYGPKIDFDIRDSMGREWQCATVQLDYQLPKRFSLEYAGEDGKQHTPAVIHRTIYGTLERFLGVLTEHCQGKFPLWLAPVQVRVMSISEQSNGYAEKIHDQLVKSGIRSTIDASDRTLEYKVREAQLQKVPLMLILGKKEQDSGELAIRELDGKQRHGVKVEEFIESVKKTIGERSNSF